MRRLSLDTVLARSADPLTAEVDDELVMLDPRDSVYYGLNAVGRRIWELLERPQSVATLCATLQDQFDELPETCHAEVLSFLERLSDARLAELR